MELLIVAVLLLSNLMSNQVVAIIVDKNEVLISFGSDNSDRSLQPALWTESLGKIWDTAKSKQMVPAVIANDAWIYDDVKDYWDQLLTRSYINIHGKKTLYQESTLSELLDLEYLFRHNPWLRKEGLVLFCGSKPRLPTVPSEVYKNYYPSSLFFEGHDPILNRTISHSFTIQWLDEQP